MDDIQNYLLFKEFKKNTESISGGQDNNYIAVHYKTNSKQVEILIESDKRQETKSGAINAAINNRLIRESGSSALCNIN